MLCLGLDISGDNSGYTAKERFPWPSLLGIHVKELKLLTVWDMEMPQTLCALSESRVS